MPVNMVVCLGLASLISAALIGLGVGVWRLTVDISSCHRCPAGTYCYSCPAELKPHKTCVRGATTNLFKVANNSLPFNKYAFLTTHNSFSIKGAASPLTTLTTWNQLDSIDRQLTNGVRAFMLDVYDFKGDVWLCHSFGGQCHDFTAYGPALDALKKIEFFLSSNPSEVVTIIFEDYVQIRNALSDVMREAGLMQFWFPVSKMPFEGDWPPVSQMVANNERLVVFTSKRRKEVSEGIAYQWNYMVENQYGSAGMNGKCTNRAESSPLDDITKSLVLVNYFRDIPEETLSCDDNSGKLLNMLANCYEAAGNRWANFVAVDFYQRNNGGGVFQALDMLNGEHLCGNNTIQACYPHHL